MTAPVRIDLSALSPDELSRLRELLRVRPGQRSLETRAALAQRDDLIREYGRRFYPGLSKNRQAECIHRDLNRYATSAWQRHRSDVECPHRDARQQMLWQILKARDWVPSHSLIQKILQRASRIRCKRHVL
jgi:hypothetical protein